MSQEEFEKFVEQLLLEVESVWGKSDKQEIEKGYFGTITYNYYFENNAYRLRCRYIIDKEDNNEDEYDEVEVSTWK